LLDLIRTQGFEAVGLSMQDLDFNSTSESDIEPTLHAAWLGADWATDAEQTKAVIGEAVIDWLIVDHYALDIRWESAMRSCCKKLMVIDDLADRYHDCDLLLDQNLFEKMTERYIEKIPDHCCLILGPNYALLQSIYAQLHRCIPPREGRVHRILIYFGGADTNNLTGMAVAACCALEQEDLTLDVVINPSNPHAEILRRQIEGRNRITLYEGLPSLAPLIAKADLSIGASGTTSWERCCLGLPSIVITLAENQTPIARELDRLGLIWWLNDASEVKKYTLVSVLRDICATGLKSEWSLRCREKVDGYGTKRVASILMINAKTELCARPANVDDEALALRLANNLLPRHREIASDDFDATEFRAEFRRCLRDTEYCKLYIVETKCRLPIGWVRFDRTLDSWAIDYQMDVFAVNHGLMVSFLRTAILALRNGTTGLLIFSRINRSNPELQIGTKTLKLPLSDCNRAGLAIAVCSDASSWINSSVPELLLGWLNENHSVSWTHAAEELRSGDLCFYLSYGKIVGQSTLDRYRNNLVVHGSDLPKGRGWSPTTWLILEGVDRIPVTLLEAVDAVDAGPIYLQEWINLNGTELIDDWRKLLSITTVRLARSFVAGYPAVLNLAREQSGEITTYPRRYAKDSIIDPNKNLNELFNHLRTVDNKNYPAFFSYKGKEFTLKISIK
jgi:UDP-2,4-diacetamido-2,4,6-trideoxy-beta-L-altropyranose hydrolase